MIKDANDIVEDLTRSMGFNFEKAVCRAFRFLGLDSKWIGDLEGEPDVLATSQHSTVSFRAVCECCAANDTNEVGMEKVGQIRSSGPKHKGDADMLYLLVVGRPKFSSNAVKSAKPDVCLLLASELAELVTNHSYLQFSDEDLEKVFLSIGKATDSVKDIIESLRNRLEATIYICALICVAATKFAREQESSSAKIAKSLLIATTRAYGEALGVGVFSFDEIEKGLVFLSSPIINLFIIEQEEVRLRSRSVESLLTSISQIGPNLSLQYKSLLSELGKSLRKAKNPKRILLV